MPPPPKRKGSLFNNLLTSAENRPTPPAQSHFFHYSPPPPITQKQAIERAVVHEGLTITSLFHLQAAPVSRKARPQSRKVSRAVHNPTEEAAHAAARAIVEQERLRRIHTEDALQIVRKRQAKSRNGTRPIRQSSSDDDDVIAPAFENHHQPSIPHLSKRPSGDDPPLLVARRRRPPKQPSVRLPSELPSSPERAAKSTRVSKTVSSPARYNAETEKKVRNGEIGNGEEEKGRDVDRASSAQDGNDGNDGKSSQESVRTRGKVNGTIPKKKRGSVVAQDENMSMGREMRSSGEHVLDGGGSGVKRSSRLRKLADEKGRTAASSPVQKSRAERRVATNRTKGEGLDSDVSTDIAVGLGEGSQDPIASRTPPPEKEKEVCAEPPSARKLAMSNRTQKTRRRAKSRLHGPGQLDDSDISVIDLTGETPLQKVDLSTKAKVDDVQSLRKSVSSSLRASPSRQNSGEKNSISPGEQRKRAAESRAVQIRENSLGGAKIPSLSRNELNGNDEGANTDVDANSEIGKTHATRNGAAVVTKSPLRKSSSPEGDRNGSSRTPQSTANDFCPPTQTLGEKKKASQSEAEEPIRETQDHVPGAGSSDNKSPTLPSRQKQSSSDTVLRSSKSRSKDVLPELPRRRLSSRKSKPRILMAERAVLSEKTPRELQFRQTRRNALCEIPDSEAERAENPLHASRGKKSPQKRRPVQGNVQVGAELEKSPAREKANASPARKRAVGAKKRPTSQHRKSQSDPLLNLRNDNTAAGTNENSETLELGPQSMSVGCDDVSFALNSFSKRLRPVKSEDVLSKIELPTKDLNKRRVEEMRSRNNEQELLTNGKNTQKDMAYSRPTAGGSVPLSSIQSERRKRRRETDFDKQLTSSDSLQKKASRTLGYPNGLAKRQYEKVNAAKGRFPSRSADWLKSRQLGSPFRRESPDTTQVGSVSAQKRKFNYGNSLEPAPKAIRKGSPNDGSALGKSMVTKLNGGTHCQDLVVYNPNIALQRVAGRAQNVDIFTKMATMSRPLNGMKMAKDNSKGDSPSKGLSASDTGADRNRPGTVVNISGSTSAKALSYIPQENAVAVQRTESKGYLPRGTASSSPKRSRMWKGFQPTARMRGGPVGDERQSISIDRSRGAMSMCGEGEKLNFGSESPPNSASKPGGSHDFSNFFKILNRNGSNCTGASPKKTARKSTMVILGESCTEGGRVAEAGDMDNYKEAMGRSPSVHKSPLGSKRVSCLQRAESPGMETLRNSVASIPADLLRPRSTIAVMERCRVEADEDAEFAEYECRSPLPPVRKSRGSPRKSVQGSPVGKKAGRVRREVQFEELMGEAEMGRWDSGLPMEVEEDFVEVKKAGR